MTSNLGTTVSISYLIISFLAHYMNIWGTLKTTSTTLSINDFGTANGLFPEFLYLARNLIDVYMPGEDLIHSKSLRRVGKYLA